MLRVPCLATCAEADEAAHKTSDFVFIILFWNTCLPYKAEESNNVLELVLLILGVLEGMHKLPV